MRGYLQQDKPSNFDMSFCRICTISFLLVPDFLFSGEQHRNQGSCSNGAPDGSDILKEAIDLKA